MIRCADMNDLQKVTALGLRLWPGYERKELAGEFEALLRDPEARVFLLEEGGKPSGFAQCQLRHDYVEGTAGSPVGYLEGIYVNGECRGRGCARALLRACEDCAREMGCREFAGDCELNNTDSPRFHLRMGFEEANRIICFRKTL